MKDPHEEERLAKQQTLTFQVTAAIAECARAGGQGFDDEARALLFAANVLFHENFGWINPMDRSVLGVALHGLALLLSKTGIPPT